METLNDSLYRAIVEGDVPKLDEFKSSLHLRTILQEDTALHLAVQYEKKQMVEEILKLCPSSFLLIQNLNGDTPLHIASRYGLSDIVELLINQAKRLGDKDIESGTKDSVTKQLVGITNNEKNTALHEAVKNNNEDVYNVVKLLTESDRDIEYLANNAGETPLYLAAACRWGPDVVDQILEIFPSSAYDGPHGQTALHAAVIHCSGSRTVDMLVKWKPSMNKVTDDRGWAPIHYAAFANDDIASEVLLEDDASVAYIRDKEGMSPLHIAAVQGNTDVIETMIDIKPDCWQALDLESRNFLNVAAIRGRKDVVKQALEHVITARVECINHPDNEGNTPLLLAALFKNYDIVKLLIKHDRVNIVARNHKTLNALDILMQHEYIDDTSGLLDALIALRNVGLRVSRGNIGKEKQDGTEQALRYQEILQRERERSQIIKSKHETKRQKMLDKIQKMSDGHLVVAALIATVTFTAGFSVPGGFKSDTGMASLVRVSSFRAFAVSNTIAMLLSSLAILFHFVMKLIDDEDTANSLLMWAFYCTFGAIVVMMLAFVTGVYAVLADSPSLAIATCVIGCSFFLLCFFPLRHVSHSFIIARLRHVSHSFIIRSARRLPPGLNVTWFKRYTWFKRHFGEDLL